MGKTLIVAEKPAAGKDIAKVVGATEEHSGYMEGRQYVVTWAVGHLIGLKEPQEHDEKYSRWVLEDLPISFGLSDSLKVLPVSRKQYSVIKALIHRRDIDMLINAGDAGREGYLIQEWIYRMVGCRLPKKVLWASSLSKAGIQAAMDNLKDNSLPEFQGILREAETRAEGDYLLGYNYSRLLTITRAYKQSLSYGRCQTPLLYLVCQRDKAVREFKPEPYWSIEATYSKGFKGVLVDNAGKTREFFDKEEADAALRMITGAGKVVEYDKQEKREKAPLLYNLAKLQQHMGRKYSFAPDKTLKIAQTLYEKYKILSYPRTDSQYLSMDIYGEIEEHLESCRFGKFTELIDRIDMNTLKADKSYFNDFKVTDHHALIPTINASMQAAYAALSDDERKVFDTVVLALIAIFYPEYMYDATKIIVGIGGGMFQSTGTTIRQLGYKAVLKDNGAKINQELQILPLLQEGDSLAIDACSMIGKKTVPPLKYSDETIIKAMEKYGIGTSATRAEIINKLQNPKRQFIVRENGKYSATELGEEYIRIVPQELKAPELTQHFEEELRRVNEGSLSKEEFLGNLLRGIEDNITKFTSEPVPDSEKIGYSAATQKENKKVLGKCPKCGAEVKFGQYGAYCTGKCGMSLGRIRGKELDEGQVVALLNNERVYVTGLKKKDGGTYSAYFTPEGIEPYSYKTQSGQRNGYQFKFKAEMKPSKNNRR